MRLCLIHWHEGEAAEYSKRLRALGHTVSLGGATPEHAKRLRADPPELFLICLDRLPSHGREVAGALLEWRSTREVPILFVGGAAEKVAKLKQTFPKSRFTSWQKVESAIKQAMANPPSLSAMQEPRPAGYSGTPLPRKLGIKEGSVVGLVAPPEGFTATLGALPAGATLHSNPRAARDLTICFVRSLKELKSAMPKMVTASRQGGVWFAWPKKTSPLAADVSETEVRELGLAAGLVDHKICAIDQDWSGLRFALRKQAAT